MVDDEVDTEELHEYSSTF